MKNIQYSYKSNLNKNEIYQRLDNTVFKLIGLGDEINQNYSIKREFCGEFDDEKFEIQKGETFSRFSKSTVNGVYSKNEDETSQIEIIIKPSNDIMFLKIMSYFIVPLVLWRIVHEITNGYSWGGIIFLFVWLIVGAINYLFRLRKTKDEIIRLKKELYRIMPKYDM